MAAPSPLGNRHITITSGQTDSSVADLTDGILVGMILTADFTGTSVTFKGSNDNSTFYTLYNDAGTALTCTIGSDSSNRYFLFAPTDFVGVRYLKVVSGSSEGADRTITLITRRLT